MPNGERRFEEDWLAAFPESGNARSRREAPGVDDGANAGEKPRGRPRWKERVPPWERKALVAESQVKIERARQEVERLRVEAEAKQSEANRTRQICDAERLEQIRLVALKQAGRMSIPWYPPELTRHVLPEIDEWVTSRNVPAYLSPLEQKNLVTSFVQERTTALTVEAQRRMVRDARERAERERAKAEADRVERERNAKVQSATIKRAVEDRELDAMESGYQERRALVGLARMLKR
jgi:hypothetical protein